MNSSLPRERAHTVCIQCHGRKVKCNLEDSLGSKCSNCLRFGHQCIPRTAKRLKRTRSSHCASNPAIYQSTNNREASVAKSQSPCSSPVQYENRSNGDQSQPEQHAGFIADHSVLAYDNPSPLTASEGWLSPSTRVKEAVLAATEATTLPTPPLRRALIDAYFEHVFHNYPIVTREDVLLPHASLILQQAVCLAGSLVMRQPDNLQLAYSLYEKVKSLIYLNYEPDELATLKAMCLLSCWSVKPPDKISLDGPWYWTGVASRLAIQIGLHRESTYTNIPASSHIRAIFWNLHNADKLQVACWGRPPAISLKYADVRPLEVGDFEEPNIQIKVFIYTTMLSRIFGEIAELHLEKQPVPPHEALRLTQALCNWVKELPDELQLYNTDSGRKAFSRPVCELFIKYFAAIILLHLLQSEINRQRYPSSRSLIAASCMSRLYEEIHYREQTCCLLPINGFFCMLASLPLLYYQPQSTEKKSIRQEEIEIICTVMKSMQPKYGGSEMVLTKIQRLKKEVQASVQRYLQGTSASGLPGDGILHYPYQYLEELFPFPSAMCTHMNLVGESAEFAQETIDESLAIDEDWASLLISESHNFLDLFEFSNYAALPPE